MTRPGTGIEPDAARAAIAAAARDELDLDLPPDILDGLALHLHLLYAWNPRVNLTAIRDPGEGIRRHVVESLEALPALDECLWKHAGGEPPLLADLGSGNGYPALPLLAARPGIRGELWERTARKAAFLAAVLRKTGLGVRIAVREARFEGRFPRPPAVVTLRAFPDPAATIRSLLAAPADEGEKTSARRPSILAWLAAEDANRLADELAGRAGLAVSVRPLRSHPRGALLAARPQPPSSH